MIQELVYTSASRGLKAGSKGFCTVASTAGMAANLAGLLERLSGYRHLFPPQAPEAVNNPINFSYVVASVGGKSYSITSRIADAGLDYSKRSNKLAHHIVFDPADRPQGGPAWLLGQSGLFQEVWQGDPRKLNPRPLPQGSPPPGICRHWERVTGDAGWAGELAKGVMEGRTCYLVYSPGQNVFPLFQEVIRLLPPAKRWNATFSTFFTGVPPQTTCMLRGVIGGSPEAKTALRSPKNLVVDLGKLVGAPGDHSLVEAARTGVIQSAIPGPTGKVPPGLKPNPAFKQPGTPPPVKNRQPEIEIGDGFDETPVGEYLVEETASAGPPSLNKPRGRQTMRRRVRDDRFQDHAHWSETKKDNPWKIVAVVAVMLLLLVSAVGVIAFGWWAIGSDQAAEVENPKTSTGQTQTGQTQTGQTQTGQTQTGQTQTGQNGSGSDGSGSDGSGSDGSTSGKAPMHPSVPSERPEDQPPSEPMGTLILNEAKKVIEFGIPGSPGSKKFAAVQFSGDSKTGIELKLEATKAANFPATYELEEASKQRWRLRRTAEGKPHTVGEFSVKKSKQPETLDLRFEWEKDDRKMNAAKRMVIKNHAALEIYFCRFKINGQSFSLFENLAEATQKSILEPKSKFEDQGILPEIIKKKIEEQNKFNKRLLDAFPSLTNKQKLMVLGRIAEGEIEKFTLANFRDTESRDKNLSLVDVWKKSAVAFSKYTGAIHGKRIKLKEKFTFKVKRYDLAEKEEKSRRGEIETIKVIADLDVNYGQDTQEAFNKHGDVDRNFDDLIERCNFELSARIDGEEYLIKGLTKQTLQALSKEVDFEIKVNMKPPPDGNSKGKRLGSKKRSSSMIQ